MGARPLVVYAEGLGGFEDISLRTLTLAELLHKTADVDAMLAQLNAKSRDEASDYRYPSGLII